MPEAIARALESAREWIRQEGVVAVGQGEEEGRPTIDVWVGSPGLEGRFPEELDGFRVRVRYSGEISPLEGDVTAEPEPED